MDIQDNQQEQVDQEEEKISGKDGSKKTLNRKIWTQKEDKLLEKAINELGTNWKEVAKHLFNRNPSQCAQRWKRIKPQSQRSRHSWSTEEDKQLLDLVKVHKRNWGMIASVMHWRTGKQIRERFINKLNPDIRPEPWTKEEDIIVMEAYKKYGSRWTEISKLLKGRPENMIKNRFYSFIRKEYMNIQNPYYVVPVSQDQRTDQNLEPNNQQGQEVEQIEIQEDKEVEKIVEPQKLIKEKKKGKFKKIKKLKKKVPKQKKQQIQGKKQIKKKIEDNEGEVGVLNGIAETHSSSEQEVKQEDEDDYQPAMNNQNLGQSLFFSNIHLGAAQNSQMFDPMKSVYNSQGLQSPQLSSQLQQHQFLNNLAFAKYYYEGLMTQMIFSQSMSQSQFLKENQPLIQNISSQETQQSQLQQLSLSNFNFLPPLPCMMKPESFPHSMNNSQI